MTDEQINAAIALHLGWRCVVSDSSLGVMGVPPVGNECDIPRIKNAMWTKDLNAMHEAERVLSKEQIENYCDLLWPKGYGWFCAIHTTARQRAEAFLRTLSKWEEVQG